AVMLIRRFGFINKLPLRALRAQGNVRAIIHVRAPHPSAGVAKEMVLRDQNLSATSSGNDLLSRLLVAHKKGAIDKAELMDHISMFIMAGSETTGQGVGSALYELGRNPGVQAALRAEIMRFSQAPTFDELTGKMPYLDAVTRETLRFHPPAPYMERNSKIDDVLPLRHPITDKQGTVHTEIHIKAGQTVIIPIHSCNRLDSVWGDGGVFRPERWLDPAGPARHADLLTNGWSNTLSFSDGPRNCIGYRLGECFAVSGGVWVGLCGGGRALCGCRCRVHTHLRVFSLGGRAGFARGFCRRVAGTWCPRVSVPPAATRVASTRVPQHAHSTRALYPPAYLPTLTDLSALIEFKVILLMFVRNFQFGATGDPVMHKFASSMSP
ncbi:hypothetical protein HWV62_8168, partial [Athelia sp. TMB]